MVQTMNRISEVFGVPRVLLPVVHPIDRETALKNVRMAHAAGVKGIFLIDQGMSTGEVLDLVRTIHAELPALWVGLNLLHLSPAAALERALDACDGRLDGLWSDDAGVDERVIEQPNAQVFVDARTQFRWNGLYFGGVAFKYQRAVPPAALQRAAGVARNFVDVVCTSGPGTGEPPSPLKVLTMARGLHPGDALALASGVDVHNVIDYLPEVHAFLVGTGIEERFGIFDPSKLLSLQQRIAGYG